jgi:hypothetical protein
MQTMRRLLLLLAAAMLPTVAARAVEVDFAIRAQQRGGAAMYSGEIRTFWQPNDADLPYTTAIVTSADHQVAVTSTGGGGWLSQVPTFYSSLDELITALEQPWKIHLDEGLPTERNYSLTLNLGSVATSGLAPPSIGYPAFDQAIGTLTPTFALALNTPDSYHADLYHFASSSSVFDAQTALPAGSTSWAPGVVLVGGTQYFLDLYGDPSLPGLGFSTPLDAQGDLIANWSSSGLGHAESIVRFTAVPEPASAAVLLLGLPALAGHRWHRRRSHIARSGTPCLTANRASRRCQGLGA